MSDEKALTVVTQRYPNMETWQILEKFALASFESREFKLKTMQEGLIKAQFCWDFGLPISVANTSLYVVNGRIATQSDIVAAKFRSHPDYEYEVNKLDDDGCEISVYYKSKRTGKFELAGISTYTKDDAKREGGATKDTYQKTPRNMYFARAITNAYKWYARNLFDAPVDTIEEYGMVVEGEVRQSPAVVEVKPQLKPQPVVKVATLNNNPVNLVMPAAQASAAVIDNAKPAPIVSPPTEEIPQYGFTLQKLLESVPDNDVLEVMSGEFPVTPEQINLAVHLLVKAGKINVSVNKPE